MKKIITLVGAGLLFAQNLSAQCDTTDVTGDLIISSSSFLSGVYRVTGTFKVNSGTTVFVQTNETNGCGKLEVIASEILIEGTINGDYAGYKGGTGGAPGVNAMSLTGDAVAITSCNNKDNTGIVQLEGGKAGTPGFGPGGASSATDGGLSSGPKQQCLNTDDAAGMIAGSGGAGSGAGASYGGVGGNGGNGGAGSSDYVGSGISVSSAYPVVGGTAGTGGSAGSVYGTLGGMDIQLGSGGSGAGGGGRSFDNGLGGGNGGAGGGLIILRASASLNVTGTITANGAIGQAGGQGGNGGATSKCCSDGCDDCGEATLSTGSGGAGGAGGGSGGGILLYSDAAATITGTLAVNGGDGGTGGSRGNGTSCTYSATFCGSQSLTSNNGNPGQDGGAGGGGRIKVFVPICSSATLTPTTQLAGGTGSNAGAVGTYFVGCSELSVMELAANFKLDVFPNPASNYVQIVGSESIEHAQVTIVELSGRTVYSSMHKIGSEALSIDISNLSQGTYQVVVTSEGVSVIKKLIKN
jgi:hypothetical protein